MLQRSQIRGRRTSCSGDHRKPYTWTDRVETHIGTSRVGRHYKESKVWAIYYQCVPTFTLLMTFFDHVPQVYMRQIIGRGTVKRLNDFSLLQLSSGASSLFIAWRRIGTIRKRLKWLQECFLSAVMKRKSEWLSQTRPLSVSKHSYNRDLQISDCHILKTHCTKARIWCLTSKLFWLYLYICINVVRDHKGRIQKKTVNDKHTSHGRERRPCLLGNTPFPSINKGRPPVRSTRPHVSADWLSNI